MKQNNFMQPLSQQTKFRKVSQPQFKFTGPHVKKCTKNCTKKKTVLKKVMLLIKLSVYSNFKHNYKRPLKQLNFNIKQQKLNF